MFGLDVATDVSGLIGLPLESLDLTLHQVQLRLDSLNGVVVSIESDFSLQLDGAEPVRFSQPAKAAREFASLLGVPVAHAEVTEPGTLMMRWSDGTVLRIFDSNEHHESYQVHFGERLIVV